MKTISGGALQKRPPAQNRKGECGAGSQCQAAVAYYGILQSRPDPDRSLGPVTSALVDDIRGKSN